MIERVIIAGFGGQGVILIGEILAWAAMLEGKEVTWMPSYGPETRGGTANSMVVISDEKIGSPFVECPDSAIILNKPSLEKFGPKVKAEGLVVINKSLVDWSLARSDLEVLEIKATDIAKDLGEQRAANLVILGFYLKTKGIISLGNAQKALRELASEKGWSENLIKLNEKALETGFNETNKPCT